MTIRIVRRWAVAAAGVALLCGLPVIANSLPVSVPRPTAGQIRARVLAPADAGPVAGRRALRRPGPGYRVYRNECVLVVRMRRYCHEMRD